MQVIAAVSGTTANEGYDEFNQIRAADDVLNATAGGNTYSSGYYFISFLNTPSATGAWMLQFGGHHNANNIAFNVGNIVGTTPMFEGIEPKIWTTGSVTYAPLAQEHDAMAAMLASLSTAQLTTAKLSSTFSDVTMAPGESNGNTNTFPTTKVGIACSALNTTQRALVIAAMQPWLNDIEDNSKATLNSEYLIDLDGTYISYTGSGTSGDASTFLITNTNYVRIDGPRVWIEFICQIGVVFPTQIHYHSVWRDHVHDYGKDLTLTTLPLKLVSFGTALQNNNRIVSWQTSDETNIDHFDIEYSSNGIDFTKIGTVKATNSGTTKSYSFTDVTPISESVSYYRIKIVDNAENITYSNISLVRNIIVTQISVYPNPVKNLVSVMFPVILKNASVEINDIQGKSVLYSKQNTGIKLDINVLSLKTGSYFIKITDDKSVYVSKFIKE